MLKKLRNITKYAKQTQFYPHFFKYTYPHNAAVSHQIFNTFAHFLAKSAHFSSFFQILDINALNSMYNKDLHNFITPKYPLPEEFTHRLSGGKKCKTNPIQPPTYAIRHTQYETKTNPKLMYLKVPKQTQFTHKQP